MALDVIRLAIPAQACASLPRDGRERSYYICVNEAARPASGLLEGDLAYAISEATMWMATDATTWTSIGSGGGGSAFDQLDAILIMLG